MKTISTTEARKHIKKLVDLVRDTGSVVAIGRHNEPEAILMRFPRDYNKELSDITNINTTSESFSFLKDEPDLYSRADVKRKYA